MPRRIFIRRGLFVGWEPRKFDGLAPPYLFRAGSPFTRLEARLELVLFLAPCFIISNFLGKMPAKHFLPLL